MHVRSAVAAALLGVGLAAGPQALAKDFDPADAAQDRYVQGNLLFLAYHEVGHLLQHVVLGVDQRQNQRNAEVIADDVATWLMLPDPNEPDQDEEIIAAMQGWLDAAADEELISDKCRSCAGAKISSVHGFSAHARSQQRSRSVTTPPRASTPVRCAPSVRASRRCVWVKRRWAASGPGRPNPTQSDATCPEASPIARVALAATAPNISAIRVNPRPS